ATSEITAKIDSVARKYSVSSEEFLLACWQTLLFRLTASRKIVIGCEVDGRRYEELRGSFGLFTQSLPISCQFDEADPFNVILNRVSQARRDASDWQEYFVWPANTGASADPEHFSIGFESIEYIRLRHAGQVSFSIFKQTATTERYLLKLKCEKRG